MEKPNVYFMDARSESPDTSLINKTVTVFEAAGFDKMINKGDVVAIKMHCGELGSSEVIVAQVMNYYIAEIHLKLENVFCLCSASIFFCIVSVDT